LLAAACGSHRGEAQDPKTSSEAVAASSPAPSSEAPPPEAGPVTVSATGIDALPPPDTDTGAKARRSLTMSDARDTVDPSKSGIPSLPAKLDAPPQAGVDAAIKAVPSSIPTGTLSKSALEAPLRDRARFDHCRIPYATHGEIAAVIYNGAALGVDVKTKPNDRALNFCIERAVRQMTWVKELAVNKVKVGF
jgi:hypothetical protein